MAKGIIYITTTSVNGLIKIGKTGSDQFESRMTTLEQNGYWNVSGLHRYFAVEVDDYDEKEKLIHTMFSKSQVANSELFALDKKLAQELLEAFGGKQIYPKLDISQTDRRNEKTVQKQQESSPSEIPDGVYYFRRKIKAIGKELLATMRVQNGKLYVAKGSMICPILKGKHGEAAAKLRSQAKIHEEVLTEDFQVNSTSYAGLFVLGASCNGWTEWKTKDGKPIDIYRKGGK